MPLRVASKACGGVEKAGELGPHIVRRSPGVTITVRPKAALGLLGDTGTGREKTSTERHLESKNKKLYTLNL